MDKHAKILDWIEGQAETMKRLAVDWSSINSHTANLDGLKEMSNQLKDVFSIFKEDIEFINLPEFEKINSHGKVELQSVAPALTLRKRPEASKQVLLVCHMDTVYPEGSSQKTKNKSDDQKIYAPGITDAKGGIVVLLKALEAFEQSPLAANVGWQVIINTDEEISSPASAQFLEETAQFFHLGLVFEPCLPNGDLVSFRKGSGNFTLIARGKAAHAGRDFDKGCNAINALSNCTLRISSLTNTRPGVTVNIGTIHGGTTTNVVPELAIARFNVRYNEVEDEKYISQRIMEMIKKTYDETGAEILMHGKFTASPKELNDKTLSLLKHLQRCGKEINLDLEWQGSGGVCDGSRLQAVGLPTVDTLGVQGGHIHSSDEYLLVESLVKRAQLTALCLLRWAHDEWNI